MLSLVSDFSIAEKVAFKEKGQPNPKPGEVLVQMKAVALNRRDQWIREGKYPNIKDDVILGSDGAGIIREVGTQIDPSYLGQEVVINPNVGWGPESSVQSSDYRILGMPDNGTFAEYITIPVDRVRPKPRHLSFEQAAALPLAGLTAFRALFYHGKMAQSDRVLINGVGGGVAQLAFLFAVAKGAEVYITSGNKNTIEVARKLGAISGFNYKEENWHQKAKEMTGGFHLIVDSAGGDQINKLISICKPAGRIVFYGATTGMPQNLDVYKVFWNQISLQGSTMGNDQEFDQMLNFVSDHQIEPIIDSVRPFTEIISALDKMKSSDHIGKLVMRL